MANERKKPANKRSGKRRYFRRRKKGSKPTSQGESTQQAPAPAPPGGSKRKKGRSRSRRSSRRRRGEQSVSPGEPALLESDSDYQEPVDVYIYTHIIRPAYRDYMGDYVPEHSLQFSGRATEEPPGMERLRAQIREQLDEQFERKPGTRPSVSARDLGANETESAQETMANEEAASDDEPYGGSESQTGNQSQ